MINSATRQADGLNHLVGNLLDMTRLEARAMRLNCEPVDVQDRVATVTGQMADALAQHPLIIHIPDELPEVDADAVRMSLACYG